MTFIVDNNFDDVLASLKAQAYELAYKSNIRTSAVCAIDGHAIECRAERRVVKGRVTLVATWFIDNRRRGLNAVRGALRRGA